MRSISCDVSCDIPYSDVVTGLFIYTCGCIVIVEDLSLGTQRHLMGKSSRDNQRFSLPRATLKLGTFFSRCIVCVFLKELLLPGFCGSQVIYLIMDFNSWRDNSEN